MKTYNPWLMRSSEPDSYQRLNNDVRCPVTRVLGGFDHVVHQCDLYL